MAKLWFQQIGFSENPFSIKPGVFGNKLVGYDHIVEELCYRVDAGGMVFVEGQLGTGKTSLLKLIATKYRGVKRVLYLSCNQIKEVDLNKVLFEKIGFWRRIFNLQPKGLIVLLDEVNELGKDNVEKIKHFFDEDAIKTVVFTGVDYDHVGFPQSVRERINRSIIRIANLTPDDAVKIVRNRIGKHPILTDDLIKELFKISKENPRRLIYNCEQVCRYAVASGTERATKDHIDAVMKSKASVMVKKTVDQSSVLAMQKKVEENIANLQHLQRDLAAMKGQSPEVPMPKKGVFNKVVDIFDEDKD